MSATNYKKFVPAAPETICLCAHIETSLAGEVVRADTLVVDVVAWAIARATGLAEPVVPLHAIPQYRPGFVRRHILALPSRHHGRETRYDYRGEPYTVDELLRLLRDDPSLGAPYGNDIL